MISYIWPIGLAVLSNIVYQICAKSVPEKLNPLASLTVTYIIAAIAAFVLYFCTSKGGNILQDYRSLNWAPFLLGIVIVGLEMGFLSAYKAGWPVSTAQLVQAAILAIFLIFVGFFLYKEAITWNKIAGILVCLAGLGLINYK